MGEDVREERFCRQTFRSDDHSADVDKNILVVVSSKYVRWPHCQEGGR